jgi:hypothetical protein
MVQNSFGQKEPFKETRHSIGSKRHSSVSNLSRHTRVASREQADSVTSLQSFRDPFGAPRNAPFW